MYWNNNAGAKNNGRLAFVDFMSCMSKVDTTTASSSTSKNKSTTKPQQEQSIDDDHLLQIINLSKEERCFHDFYCIATPTLYKADEETGDWIIADDTRY